MLETFQNRCQAPHVPEAVPFRKRFFDLAACVENVFEGRVLEHWCMFRIDAIDCFLELVEGVLEYQPRV